MRQILRLRTAAAGSQRHRARAHRSVEKMRSDCSLLWLMQVRQLSAVLLRKHLKSHWRRLPATAHKQIQTALQQRLVQEDVEPVRKAVAELIASIAR